MVKYHVFYVQGCYPKIKTFTTLVGANRFVAKFMRNLNEDNWVDYIYYGKRVR